ncbi:Alpha/Beta hydrolase protein [Pyrenochaeta sp. MPI-SDFR-AT-0127]|nr:Alpha/Beta hydrolase protein [Pyrenochaeta sp. MPI-SDFR-AT-0127]
MDSTLRVPYKTVDKIDIPTDIYLPSPSSKPCPVLIMVHGGAFMLGHAGMNNKDQIQDSLERGWIVLAIEHRLCPGVDVLEGPMRDVRDALQWVQDGALAQILRDNQRPDCIPDGDRVVIMGTSSGGHLALSTAWDVPKRPLAILDFYGAKHFNDPFWSQPVSKMPAHFFEPLPLDEVQTLMKEKATFIGGVSLEGQAFDPSPLAPDPKARQGFAMHHIATGKVINAIWPSTPQGLEKIDPMLNVGAAWPPLAIVHGTADTMIPMRLSKEFERALKETGAEVEFIEVEGEPHTFCGTMVKGSKTWATQRKGFDFLEKVVARSYQQ